MLTGKKEGRSVEEVKGFEDVSVGLRCSFHSIEDLPP